MKPQYVVLGIMCTFSIAILVSLMYLSNNPDFNLNIGDATVLAVATHKTALGSVTHGDRYPLNIHMCNTGGGQFNDLKFYIDIYGPDADKMPCNNEIEGYSINAGILPKGSCNDYTFMIDTSKAMYVPGENYHVVVRVYEGSNFVSNIDNSAGDFSQYESCYAKYSVELSDPSNYCGIDESTGKYLFCEGIAWSFDIMSTDDYLGDDEDEEGYTDIECYGDTDIVCTSENSYGYTICDGGVWGETIEEYCSTGEVCSDGMCISQLCSVEGDTLNETCPEGYTPELIVDKYICTDGYWTENSNEQCTLSKPSVLSPLLIIGAIFGGSALLFVGYKKGVFKKLKLPKVKFPKLKVPWGKRR